MEHFSAEYLDAPDQPVRIIETLALPTPAPGATWQYVVPPLTRIRVIGLTFSYTADANVADRNVHLHFETPAGRLFDNGDPVAIAANGFRTFIFGLGLNYAAPTATILQTVFALPNDLYLLPGNTIDTVVPTMQVGDQFSLIVLHTQTQYFRK
jgi:hypothetical protein